MRLGRTPQGASAYQETPGAWCPELETKDEKGIQKADASSEFPIIKNVIWSFTKKRWRRESLPSVQCSLQTPKLVKSILVVILVLQG